MHDQAASLILIAIAAYLLPIIANRIKAPAVVLEILFGVLVGPQMLGWVGNTEFLAVLAELGFFLLMFLSGFEIDIGTLERQGSRQIGLGLAAFALTLAGSYLASLLLGYGLFVTFVLATTSVGLVVPTLRGTRRTNSPMGQLVLLTALLADFLTLLGVTIFALIKEQGAGLVLLNIPGFFAVAAVVLLALRRAAWWHPKAFAQLFASDDPEEIGIRATLALMLTFVGLSLFFGIEAILGAFLAGTVFAMVFRHRGELDRKLNGFSFGFFIPIFFINVGLHFDVAAVFRPGSFGGHAALIVAAVLVKVVPSLIFLVRRLPFREVLAAGMLLSARLSLIIAVAELGVELELIDRTLQARVILLAAVTATFAPVLFRWLAPPLAEASNATEATEAPAKG
jgi:Kef-type K+ transport system membrane component KefB